MGLTKAQLEQFRDATVPDLIGAECRLLFVGINPGLWRADNDADPSDGIAAIETLDKPRSFKGPRCTLLTNLGHDPPRIVKALERDPAPRPLLSRGRTIRLSRADVSTLEVPNEDDVVSFGHALVDRDAGVGPPLAEATHEILYCFTPLDGRGVEQFGEYRIGDDQLFGRQIIDD